MNTKKMILTTLGLLCILLAVRSVRVVSQSNGGSVQREVTKESTIKDLLNQVTQIAVFRWVNRERKYIGSLKKDNPAFQSALNALRESQQTTPTDVSKPAYEVVLMGKGFLRLAKYDAQADVMTFYSAGEEAKPELTMSLTHSFTDLLAGAKLPEQPTGAFKPKFTGYALWPGLPDSLVRAVAESPVILIGKPVDLFRADFFDPDNKKSLAQYTVYLIEVERYLKDDTGQFMPLVKYWDYGGLLGGGFQFGEEVPLSQYNQRYLLFLEPVSNKGIAKWNGKYIRIRYPDEFISVRVSLQTPIVNGVTAQRNPNISSKPYYFFGDNTTLIEKPEVQVISEITAAINQVERERH